MMVNSMKVVGVVVPTSHSTATCHERRLLSYDLKSCDVSNLQEVDVLPRFKNSVRSTAIPTSVWIFWRSRQQSPLQAVAALKSLQEPKQRGLKRLSSAVMV